MVAETMEGVIYISHCRTSVLDGTSSIDIPDEMRARLEENLRAKQFALSTNDDNTSN